MKTPLRAVGALMLGLSLCGGLVTATHAAPAGPNMDGAGRGMRGGGMRGGGGGMRMMAQLNLTDAQKAKLMPIMQAQRTQMMALRDNTTLTPDQKKAKMKAMRDANEKKVNAILTPAQRKQMAAFKAQRKAEMKNGGGRRGPQAPAA